MTTAEQRLMNEIYCNSKCTEQSLRTILEKITDDEFERDVCEQIVNYRKLKERAEQRLRKAGVLPREWAPWKNAGKWSWLQWNTLLDISTSHMADLMMHENIRGISEMTKTLNRCPKAEKAALELARELVDFEEMSIRLMKTYL